VVPPRRDAGLSACCRWIKSTTRSQDFACCGHNARAAAGSQNGLPYSAESGRSHDVDRTVQADTKQSLT
jgi:hypothetical protein